MTYGTTRARCLSPPPASAACSDATDSIDYAEFCETLMVDPSPSTEQLFQLFDTDKSGHIDVKEFLIGLSNFTGASKDERLKFAFGMYDENGDGVITRVRTRALPLTSSRHVAALPPHWRWRSRLLAGAHAAAAAAAAELLQAELIAILKANHMASTEQEVIRKAETILAQADKDGDGVINFSEFVQVSKRFPNILYPTVRGHARPRARACTNAGGMVLCEVVSQRCAPCPDAPPLRAVRAQPARGRRASSAGKVTAVHLNAGSSNRGRQPRV